MLLKLKGVTCTLRWGCSKNKLGKEFMQWACQQQNLPFSCVLNRLNFQVSVWYQDINGQSWYSIPLLHVELLASDHDQFFDGQQIQSSHLSAPSVISKNYWGKAYNADKASHTVESLLLTCLNKHEQNPHQITISACCLLQWVSFHISPILACH